MGSIIFCQFYLFFWKMVLLLSAFVKLGTFLFRIMKIFLFYEKINNPKTYRGRWTYFMFRLICIFFLFTVCWHQWFVWRPNDLCYIMPSNKFKPLYRTNERKERKMASFNRSDLVSVVVIGWKFSMGKYLFQNARTNNTPM